MKKAEIILQYQNLIDQPFVPVPQGMTAVDALYQQACSNDKATVDNWRPIWVSQAKVNKERYGSFADKGIGKLWGKYQYMPIIIAGSGPSLKENAHKLKNRGSIPLVSCLHNFHYFEDLGIAPEFYVSLDAGPVTVEEVYEGGKKSQEEYWALTKERTLLCYIGTSPELLSKWQGEIYFFNCPIPDLEVEKEVDSVEEFHQYVSTGGNVLGACLYIAKGFLGASQIIFVGADFCFSYDHKFHAWQSKYDKNLGQCVALTDVYGVRRLTWQSYANFKSFFDQLSMRVPGVWINATEGGCLGSYPTGNLSTFKYMDLEKVFDLFNMNNHLKAQSLDPTLKEKIILF